MGFFYRPAGGGSAGNDLTIPSGPVTLDASTSSYNINLINTGTTPASVELSFQNSRMKGLNPDSGTETSPSYVVDPDAGSRTITIQRDVVSTSSQAEKVTFTSNQGSTSTIDFDLDPVNLHAGLRVLTSQDPIYEFKLAGNFTDTGTRDTGNLSLTGTPTAIASTSDLAGLVGYADFSGTHQAKVSGTQDMNWKTGQPRSVIWVGKLNAAPSIVGHLIGTGGTDGTNYFKHTSGTWQSASTYTFNYDTSQSHTDGGASVKIDTATNTEIAILYSHDGATSLTVRWKTLNGNTERTGHSFKTVTQAGKSDLTNATVFGWTSSLSNIRHRHLSFYDKTLSESDFSSITTIIGFGA